MGSLRVGFESVRDLEILLKSPVGCRFSLFGGLDLWHWKGRAELLGFDSLFFGFLLCFSRSLYIG